MWMVESMGTAPDLSRIEEVPAAEQDLAHPY